MVLDKLLDNYIYVFTVPRKHWYMDEAENDENIVSKTESEIRIFKLGSAFSLILLIVSSLLSICLHTSGKEAKVEFIYGESMKKKEMALETMKIINTYHDQSQRMVVTKNLSLLVLEEDNPAFDSSLTFFFPEIYQQYYKISPDLNKNVKIYKRLHEERLLPKTSLKISLENVFDYRSTGVRVGQFFWIFGGAENCHVFELGT